MLGSRRDGRGFWVERDRLLGLWPYCCCRARADWGPAAPGLRGTCWLGTRADCEPELHKSTRFDGLGRGGAWHD